MTLEALIGWFLAYKYPSLYVGAIIEGPVLTMAAGLLIKLKMMGFWPAYVALVLGDLSGDFVWYWIGYSWAHPFVRRFGRFVSIDEALLERIKHIFHRYHEKILFVSKITMGFGFAIGILMVAGMVRVPLRKFAIFNAMGQCIWTAMLISIGYFFGQFYVVVDEGFKTVSLLAFFITVIVLLGGVGNYLRKRNVLRSL